MTDDLDRLLTAKEVTAMVGIAPATLYRLLKKGQFPQGIRLGFKLRRWRRSQVWEYVSQREEVPE